MAAAHETRPQPAYIINRDLESHVAEGRVRPLPIVSPPMHASKRIHGAPSHPKVIQSSWTLAEISQFYPTTGGCAVGDTDHDLQSEIIVSVNDELQFSYRILENQGGNTYSEVYQSPSSTFHPSAIGDLDLDGNADLVGQYSYYLQIYESPDHTSYPTQIAWSSPALSNFWGRPLIADSDGDGIPEIIHTVVKTLAIYEWSPISSEMELVFYKTVDSAQYMSNTRVVADLDSDGRCEIAVAGSSGYVHVLRSTGNNPWTEAYSDSTGLSNAYGVAGGRDTDGNGRPEVFVLGDDDEGNDVTYVYEASGSNTFTRIGSILIPSTTYGGHENAVPDLVGNGRGCYLAMHWSEDDLVQHLLVFESPTAGIWNLVQDYAATSSAYEVLNVCDANNDGREEIFWEQVTHFHSGAHSSILGVPKEPAALQATFQATSLQVAPSPCRDRTDIRIPATAPQASSIYVFDVAGRLLDRRPVPSAPGTRVEWSVDRYPQGTYFLQLRDAVGASLASGRVVVAR